MTDKLPMIKLGVHIVSSLGVTKVVGDIIKNNTNVHTTFDAVRVWTGALVIGSMISEQASNHVSNRMDTVIAWYESKNAIK